MLVEYGCCESFLLCPGKVCVCPSVKTALDGHFQGALLLAQVSAQADRAFDNPTVATFQSYFLLLRIGWQQ